MNTKVFLKETTRRALRLHPQYIAEMRRMRHGVDENKMLERAVRRAVRNVPYYQKYAPLLEGGFDISRFPILRKKDILDRSKEFVSRRAFKPLLKRKETGGSTGVSLELFYSPATIVRKNAVVDLGFEMIGKGLRRAVLRGNVPSDGKIYEFVGDGSIILSSYLLNSDTLDSYLDILRSNDVGCLHVYPSSITVLARLIIARYGTAPDLPALKGIFASSEVFSSESKEIVKQAFPGIKIVDMYGHNEVACAALSVDGGPFTFYPSFGYVEFIPTGEIVNGMRVAEIVATSVLNHAMPLIRYGTDDFVLLDDSDRPMEILGRSSDLVVDLKGEYCPCIVATRDISFVNVTNFQYFQPEAGKLVMRVVVTPNFAEQDRKYILEDMQNSFRDRMTCDVVVVEDVERTKIGKQKRLVSAI